MNKCLFVLCSLLGSMGAEEKESHFQKVEVRQNQTMSIFSGEIGGSEIALFLEEVVPGEIQATFANLSLKYDLPVDSFTFDGENIHFEIKAVFVTFEGKWNPSLAQISGNLTQGDETFSVVFERGGLFQQKSKHLQEPIFPVSYKVEEVFYLNVNNDRLAATLTLPNAESPVPAVLLIGGSGQVDRDETVLGQKPFWILADFLTQNGIAVLRVDKRGCGRSTGDYESATIYDFAQDVDSSLAYLQARPEIDRGKVGLLGHGEGVWVASLASLRDVAFQVSLAGSFLTAEKMIEIQNALLLKAVHEKKETIRFIGQIKKNMLLVVKDEKDPLLALEKLEKILKENETLLGAHLEQIKAFAKGINTPAFRALLTFNPSLQLKQIKIPFLALYGEHDLIVSPQENIKALKEVMNKDWEVDLIPKVDHMFHTCLYGVKTAEEYAKSTETISPLVLEKIAKWILNRKNGS